MARKEVINECIEIWNNSKLSQEQKDNEILKVICDNETEYNRKEVEKLLNELIKSGVNVDSEKLWNMMREY